MSLSFLAYDHSALWPPAAPTATMERRFAPANFAIQLGFILTLENSKKWDLIIYTVLVAF